MDTYPDYRPGEVEKEFQKFPAEDKEIIENFILSCSTTCNPRKAADIRRIVIQFRHIVGTSFSALTIQTLRQFLVLLQLCQKEPWTKHDIRAYVKRFLKWHFKDWSQRFNELREMKGSRIGVNEKRINARTLLKKQEIETIMRQEHDPERKAFFIALYESGMRPSELRTLKWEEISFNTDGDISEITYSCQKITNPKPLS